MNKGLLRGQHATGFPVGTLLASSDLSATTAGTSGVVTSSTSLVDVAADSTVTFVAPPNGRVVVLHAGLASCSGTAIMRWGARDQDSKTQSAAMATNTIGGVTGLVFVVQPRLVTGLTPGRTYTLTWQHKVDSGSGSTFPLLMHVAAAA